MTDLDHERGRDRRGAPDGPSLDPLAALVGRAPIALGQVDVERQALTYVNDRWRAITGIREPTPIDFSALRRRIHPDDLDAVDTAFEEAIRAGTALDVSTRLVRPDGTERHVRFEATPVPDERGVVTSFAGAMSDVTELVEVNEVRRRNEQRYRDLIAGAPVGQALYRVDGAMIEVNRAWASLVGREVDEVIGRKAQDFVYDLDRAEAVDIGMRLLSGEVESVTRDRRLVTRSGEPVWVSSTITLERDADGEPLYFHSLVIDISEKKAAERELRMSEARYRRLVEDAPVGQLVAKLDGTLVEVNNAFVAMMRTNRERLFARRPTELFHPDDLLLLQREVRRLIDGEVDYFETERRMLRDDGSIMWVSGGTTIIGDDRTSYLHSIVQDVTERRMAEEALRESETRFRDLADSLPLGVFRSSVDGRLVYVNRHWGDITGIAPEDGIGRDALELVHPDDLSRIQTARDRQILERGTFAQQVRIVTDSGDVRWVSVHATAATDVATGELTGVIGSMEDVTPLVSAQEETARLAGIVEATSDMVGLADAESGQLQYLNRAARELLGYENTDIASLTALDLYAEDAQATWRDAVSPALAEGKTWNGELGMRTADGAVIPVWQTIAAKRRDGRMTQISAVGRDVTERRRFEAALAHQATHDALTGLPNRALLLDHLGLALARSDRGPNLVALLFLDLDRFKSVNDTLGHEAGDDLLIAVAQRISEVLRPADTVARLGGDEFVILCEEVVDEHHAVSIAQRVLSLVETQPFVLQGTSLALTASIGIALSPGGEGAHAEALLRDADAAMYRAKDLGRARLELFDESMRRRSAERLRLADELATALEHGQIVLHYQPCMCLQTGRIVAIEALARWAHPERGLLPPAEFIEVAEETGLIVGLGLRVLTEACNQARQWVEGLGHDAPRMHVNISARQLTTNNLAELVGMVLDASGLAPERLCLEITESVLMEDAASVIEALRRLKDLGLTLAIDDFGTGYSSLSYLRRFPVDVLKVDQSFVDGLGPDPEDTAIVAAIVNLAETLELQAIAEGVETAEQLQLLRELGCAGAQGFYLAHPAPAEEVTPLLVRSVPLAE
jgi:diguanylate cyclase (GGDEF)-like protein/PAS domain S-box-containing protein